MSCYISNTDTTDHPVPDPDLDEKGESLLPAQVFPLLKERETASGGSRTSKRAASESIGRRNRRRISPVDYGQDIQEVRHDRVAPAGHRQGRQRVRAHRQVAVGCG